MLPAFEKDGFHVFPLWCLIKQFAEDLGVFLPFSSHYSLMRFDHIFPFTHPPIVPPVLSLGVLMLDWCNTWPAVPSLF